ncbi:MAG: neutral/alkaline non-lysosomal ceramidase N-terminal domain-containing protein [Clostridia bacterium]|nr:neutral/alkaline non-lysosomal ceramidase N-terminal domain-containing protein [Clostridia bacterium]
MILAGAYKSVVTPHVGINLDGDFKAVKSEGIMDDLYVNAIVFDDGKKEVALVSADVCNINSQIIDNLIIPRITDICGIDKNNIIISATHTHGGPLLFTSEPELFGEVSDSYVDFFVQTLASCVFMAKKNKRPVYINIGKSINKDSAFNRRLKKPDGSIVMNFVEEEYLKDCVPSGTADYELLAARIDDTEGITRALIVNYANHNNIIMNNNITSDMAGAMRETLEKIYQKDVVILFLLGACGNVNWINYKNRKREKARNFYKLMGMSLAGTVLQAMLEAEKIESPVIYSESKVLKIIERPYRDYDSFVDYTFGKSEELKNLFFEVYKKDKEKNSQNDLKIFDVPVNVFSIGDNFAISTNPAELFCEFGIEIKQKSPFKFTMVAGLTNGYCGYVPTRQAFDEGGYEVRKLQNSSYLDINAGELILNESLKLLKNAEKNYNYFKERSILE